MNGRLANQSCQVTANSTVNRPCDRSRFRWPWAPADEARFMTGTHVIIDGGMSQ